MRIGTFVAVFGVGLASASFSSGVARAADPTPVEAYAKLPFFMEARLSPDGTMVAAIVPVDGRSGLVILHLDGTSPVVIPTDNYTPNWVRWKNDHQLIASVRSSFVGAHDVVSEVTRLVAIDAVTGSASDIGGGRENHMLPISRRIQDAVVDLLPNDPKHIILNTGFAVEKINIDDASSTTVERPKLSIWNWVADTEGNIRLGIAAVRKQQVIYVRKSAGAEWEGIDQGDPDTETPLRPISFSSDPNIFFAEAVDAAGFWAAYEYDIAKKSLVRQIASLPDRDAELLRHDGKLVGCVVPAERAGVDKAVYFDPVWERDVEAINRALPNTLNVIIDRSVDGKRLLVLTRGLGDPGAYYVLDRHGPKSAMDPLGELYPALDPEQIIAPKEISYRSRDGMLIHGYAVLPKDAGSHPVPFVVIPHDGPRLHDGPYFGYWTQFLASRGYGVLLINYRGSTGYGSKLEQAGLKQWGLAMQDDITDGTKWVIDQKLADPKRMCIMGAGWGGYAALMGAAKEPDLYQCAISYGGLFDLAEWISVPVVGIRDREVPGIDGNRLHETSPSEQADRIKAAVLLVHGRMDFNVPINQTQVMESALKHAGKSVETQYFDDEDHYLSHESDRIAFLKAVEKFLAQHIGAKGS